MIGYFTTEKFLPELLYELKNVRAIHGTLVLADGPLQNTVWAHNIWLNPEIISFESISQAVRNLKERGKLWSAYSFDNHQIEVSFAERLVVDKNFSQTRFRRMR